MNALIPTPIDAAMRYAACGLRVIPIRPGEKRPAIAKWTEAATTDTEQIKTWWSGSDAANGIGLALGRGGPLADAWIFAIDIDGESHGVDGEESWREWLDEIGANEPETVEAITGGGGRHLLFWSEHEITNGDTLGLAGVDTRGNGGQIVVEPTVHPSGQRYSWVDGCAPWERQITEAPEWLIGALLARRTATPAPAEATTTPNKGDRPGDRWAETVSWSELLERDGWTLHHVDGAGEHHWTRPGKSKRDGTSATTGYLGSDVLKVFTSSIPWLRAEETYSKLGYLAARDHGGDISAAAAHLSAQGFGQPPDTTSLADWVATHPDDWPEPTELETPPELPPWPVEVLPAWMGDHIVRSADQLQVPIDLCAQFALGAAAAALMGSARVVVGGRWREPLNLFLATALPSGGGKSPAERMMTAPLREWEAEQREASMELVVEETTRHKILEARAISAEKSAALPAGSMAEAIEARIDLAKHEIPWPFRRLADDATPERLTELIAHHGGKIAVMSTEAELLDMAAGAYSGGRLPNIAVYLKGFSGDPMMVDRKGGSGTPGTELRIDEPLLTVGLAMQPTVVDFVGRSNDQLKGRGFLARFMFSRPLALSGERDRSRVLDAPDDSTTAADYRTCFLDLANAYGRAEKAAEMHLTDEAARHFVGWLQTHEARLNEEWVAIREWAAKMQSSALRVAGILHLCDGRDPAAQVDVETIERAIVVAEYWIAHALSMAVHPVESDVISASNELLKLVERKRIVEAKPRALWLSMRARFRTIEEMVPALQHLESCGYLRLRVGQWVEVGVQKAEVVIEFNPRRPSKARRAFTRVTPPSVNPTISADREERLNARNARNGKRVGFFNQSININPPTTHSPESTRVTRVCEPEENNCLPQKADEEVSDTHESYPQADPEPDLSRLW